MDEVFEINLAGHRLSYAFRCPKTKLYFRSWLKPSDGHADIQASPEEIARARAQIPVDSGEDNAEFKVLSSLTGRALLRWNCCVFHAVAFIFQDQAWLLTAPSGTGKSTQFLNWRKLYPAEITMISGDMPILELSGGDIVVRPSPWNGKEDIGSLLSAPLGGVVLLEQGKENSIERMEARPAIEALFKQFAGDPETEEDILAICALLGGILKTPIWKMINRGDLASTNLMRETLAGKNGTI